MQRDACWDREKMWKGIMGWRWVDWPWETSLQWPEDGGLDSA